MIAFTAIFDVKSTNI